MRSKVSLLCLPAIIKFKLNIKFRLSILGGRINYDYPGSVKLISYNFSVIFIFSSFEGEYSVGNIFFSWTNQSRVLRNIGKREIVDGYKNRKGNVFVRENNYTPKIGKRRMSNWEFLPLPALLYHSFRRFPTGPRSRSTIDRCRFSFFFFLRRNNSNNNFNPFAKIVDRERSFIIVDGVCWEKKFPRNEVFI